MHTFPESDRAFRKAALAAVEQALAAAAPRDDAAPADIIDAATDLLSENYRNAVVILRDSLAGFGGDTTWYAYRDGRVREANEERDRLYRALEQARVSVAESGQAMSRSRAALAKTERR